MKPGQAGLLQLFFPPYLRHKGSFPRKTHVFGLSYFPPKESILNKKPTDITANKQTRELTITWDDGHIAVYPFGLLRAACPCASCRGGHENMGSEPDPMVFGIELGDSPATRIANISAVGSYALSIAWEDGHDYGIYNWHYLRALCPCKECQQHR